MKKVSLLVLICMILSLTLALASCGEEEHVHEWNTSWVNDGTYHFRTCKGCSEKYEAAKHVDANGDNACDTCKFPIANLYSKHEHEYNTVWSFDDENHFYTCKTCVAVKDSAPHADADGNNACDVCGYVIDNLYAPHEHTFGESWLFDKDNHFKRCDACTEVSESAPHTDADNNSFCDECGCLYIPYVAADELADVIDTAYENEDLVNGGEIFYASSDGTPYKSHTTTTFTIGKDNLFADYQEHKVVFDLYGTYEYDQTVSYNNVNGTLIAYINDSGDEVRNFTNQSSDWLYGFAYSSIYGTSGDPIYGLGEVIYTLYEAGVENGSIFANIVEETVEDVTTTYYSFMIEQFIGTDFFEISVVFTIGEAGNFETADIVTLHSYADEDGNLIYGVADYVYNYSVTQTVGEFSETPVYDPEEYYLKNFNIVDSENNVIDNDNGIELKLGGNAVLNITDITPVNSVLYEVVSVAMLDSNGSKTWNATAAFDAMEKTVTVNAYSHVGSYYLAVYMHGDEENPDFLIPVTIDYIEPTSIGAGVNGSTVAVTEATVYAGTDTIISGIVGEKQNPAITATLTGANAADATLVEANGAYTFNSDVAGTYTVEVKSAVNSELPAVILTITVETPPTAEELLAASGKFYYDIGWGDYIELVFDSNAGTMVCTYVWYGTPYVTNYTYTVADGEIVLEIDGDAGEYYISDLAFNNMFELTANGYTNGTLYEMGVVFSFIAADAPKFEDVIAQAGKFYYDAGQGDYVEFVFDTEAGTITSDYYYWNNHYTATYNYVLDGNNLTATPTTELSGTYVTNISLNADFTISADLYTDNVKSDTATLAFVADSGSDDGEDTTATVITPSTNSEDPQTIELVSGKYQMTLAAGESAYFIINDPNASNYEILVECDTGLRAWIASKWTPTGTMEIVDPQYPTVGYIFWIQNDTEAEITATFTFTVNSLE